MLRYFDIFMRRSPSYLVLSMTLFAVSLIVGIPIIFFTKGTYPVFIIGEHLAFVSPHVFGVAKIARSLMRSTDCPSALTYSFVRGEFRLYSMLFLMAFTAKPLNQKWFRIVYMMRFAFLRATNRAQQSFDFALCNSAGNGLPNFIATCFNSFFSALADIPIFTVIAVAPVRKLWSGLAFSANCFHKGIIPVSRKTRSMCYFVSS